MGQTSMNPQVNITKLPEKGCVKAICSVKIYEAVVIRGVMVIRIKRRLRVVLPQYHTGQRSRDMVYMCSKGQFVETENAVMKAYRKKLTEG